MRLALLVALAIVAQVPRDARPPQPATGTASIAGVVMVDQDAPQPLRRARVTAASAELPDGRTTITDDDGRYRIDGLPAGRYAVRAAREGFVPMSYGARRTSGAGTRVVVGPRDARRDVNLRLPRGAVLSGRITDASGEPMAGVTVGALQRTFVPAVAQWRLVSRGRGTLTDDRGEYRLFGLAPGEYTVRAAVTAPRGSGIQTVSEDEIQRALTEVREANSPFRSRPGFSAPPAVAVVRQPEPRREVSFAPVHFPGTTRAANAGTVRVERGEERDGLDFTLEHVPTASVSGTVVMPQAAADVQIEVRLVPAETAGPVFVGRSARILSGGTFTFAGVLPGAYTLAARSLPGAVAANASPSSASLDVIVDGEPIDGVVLVGRPDLVISGHLRFEGSASVSSLPSRRVPLPLAASGSALAAATAVVTPDGRFTMTIPAGRYHLQPNARGIRRPIGRWFLTSVSIDGYELLDGEIELREGTSDAVLTFSDAVTEITGKVLAPGRDLPDGYVVIFSTNRRAWFPGSRRIAGVKVGEDGTYTAHNLPAGEYWAVATAEIEDGEWDDPATLERLAESAVRITVPQNGKKLVDLRPRIR